MAKVNNLYIDQGSDYTTIVVVESDTELPFDLTDYTATSQMRKSFGSSYSHDFTCTIVDALSGEIHLSLLGDDSSTIRPGRWLYDVEILHTVTGEKRRVCEGQVIITPEITKT